MPKPILLEFEAVHNCWAVDVTERCKDGFIRFDNIVKDNGKMCGLVYINSPDINLLIDRIKKHPKILKTVEIFKRKNSAEVHVVFNDFESVVKGVWNSHCISISPIIAENGVDKVRVLAPNNKHIKSLLEFYKENFDIKILTKRPLDKSKIKSLDFFRTSGFFELMGIKERLSEQQILVFETACKMGYYRCPKDLTLTDVARRIDIAESTVRHHLRLAESKLMPDLSQIIKFI